MTEAQAEQVIDLLGQLNEMQAYGSAGVYVLLGALLGVALVFIVWRAFHNV